MPSLFLQATTQHLMFIEGASTLPIGERSGVTLSDADRQAEVASLRITLEGALESGESVLVNAIPVGGGEVVSGSEVLLNQRASLQHYQVSKKSVSHSQTDLIPRLVSFSDWSQSQTGLNPILISIPDWSQSQTDLIPRLISFTNWFSLIPIPPFSSPSRTNTFRLFSDRCNMSTLPPPRNFLESVK